MTTYGSHSHTAGHAGQPATAAPQPPDAPPAPPAPHATPNGGPQAADGGPQVAPPGPNSVPQHADPGSPGPNGGPQHADPPVAPPAPADAPADPAATGTGPGHGPVPPAAAGRDPRTGYDGSTGPATGYDGSAGTGHPGGDAAGPLLDRDARDQLTARLHHAVTGFVDGPHRAVEEADAVFDQTARHLGEALARRRDALRQPWQQTAGGAGESEATEQLRLVLQEYKEATERLLRL